MPGWGWVVVSLVGGLGGGVVATRMKLSHEWRSELRGRRLDALDEVARGATHWADAVQTAIGARAQDFLDSDDSQSAYDEAEEALKEARSAVNHLQVLFGLPSKTTQYSTGFAVALETALDQLRDWPPEPEDEPESFDDEPESFDESDDSSEDDFDPVVHTVEEALSEAALWHRLALDQFILSREAAAEEAQAGPVTNLRRRKIGNR